MRRDSTFSWIIFFPMALYNLLSARWVNIVFLWLRAILFRSVMKTWAEELTYFGFSFRPIPTNIVTCFTKLASRFGNSTSAKVLKKCMIEEENSQILYDQDCDGEIFKDTILLPFYCTIFPLYGCLVFIALINLSDRNSAYDYEQISWLHFV